MIVHTVKALEDNFIFVLHDPVTSKTFVIDPSEAKPALDFCRQKNYKIDSIITTHHHWDHVGGNLEIQKETGCPIIGFVGDKDRVPGITQTVTDGESLKLGSLTAKVIHIPGHTTGHIAYYFENEQTVFCGDTLFVMGCGRLFEGTAKQMFDSFKRLASLPKTTKMYCAHEYSLSNARFALSLEPGRLQNNNYATLQERLKREGQTVPTSIGYELEWNPFMRCKTPSAFEALRKLKDTWKDSL